MQYENTNNKLYYSFNQINSNKNKIEIIDDKRNKLIKKDKIRDIIINKNEYSKTIEDTFLFGYISEGVYRNKDIQIIDLPYLPKSLLSNVKVFVEVEEDANNYVILDSVDGPFFIEKNINTNIGYYLKLILNFKLSEIYLNNINDLGDLPVSYRIVVVIDNDNSNIITSTTDITVDINIPSPEVPPTYSATIINMLVNNPNVDGYYAAGVYTYEDQTPNTGFALTSGFPPITLASGWNVERIDALNVQCSYDLAISYNESVGNVIAYRFNPITFSWINLGVKGTGITGSYHDSAYPGYNYIGYIEIELNYNNSHDRWIGDVETIYEGTVYDASSVNFRQPARNITIMATSKSGIIKINQPMEQV